MERPQILHASPTSIKIREKKSIGKKDSFGNNATGVELLSHLYLGCQEA